MQELTLDIKDFGFDSKIKFYYSLLYISSTDLRNIKKYFGDYLKLFNDKSMTLPVAEYYPLKNNLQRVKKVYDQIKLSDEQILSLFHLNEIKNSFKLFLKKHETEFDYNNQNDIEVFCLYLILEKVESHITYGTLREFFKFCNELEFQNAINSFDYKTKRELYKIFGNRLQSTTTFKGYDEVKNKILIELYNYILSNRKPRDISSIIKPLEQDITFRKMKLTDYIRNVRNDSSLNDDQIIETISELDYMDKSFLRFTYGVNYEQEGSPDDIKRFNSIINKLNKSLNKQEKNTLKSIKRESGNIKKRKHETLKEFLEENNITREDFDKALKLLTTFRRDCVEYYYGLKDDGVVLSIKEIALKLDKKESNVRSTFYVSKKEILKLIETREIDKPKKERKKSNGKGRKQETLEEFLKENNITREDFDKALKSLTTFRRDCVEYYYGLKDDGVVLSIKEIALKLDKKESNVRSTFYVSKKEILKLIETREIDKPKKERKKSNGKGRKQETLEEFLKENNITREDFDKALKSLTTFRRDCIEYYYGLKEDGVILSIKDIALKLSKKESNAKTTFYAAKKEILKLIETREIDKPVEERKKSNGIERKNKTLENFLEKNNISREDFDKALKRLSKFQRDCIEYYYGLKEDEIRLSYAEIALKLNKTKTNISNALSIGKKRILKLIETGKIDKPKNERKKSNDGGGRKQETLEEFLKENNINREDFNKTLKLITTFRRDCIEYYYGLKEDRAVLSIKEISIKLNKKEPNVGQTIRTTKKQILELIETREIDKPKNERKKSNDGGGRKHETLEEFLRKNNITKEDFDKALKLLTTFRRDCIEYYYGLKEDRAVLSIKEISIKLNKTEANIKSTFYAAKKEILEYIKSGELENIINAKKIDEINAKLNKTYKVLLNDEEFKKLVRHTSPIGATALSLVANFNFSLSELATALVIDIESVIKLLMEVSTVAIEYIKNPLYSGPIDFNDLDIKKDPTFIMKEGTNK